MTWGNGFSYEGQWERNKPLDRQACLHPLIRKMGIY